MYSCTSKISHPGSKGLGAITQIKTKSAVLTRTERVTGVREAGPKQKATALFTPASDAQDGTGAVDWQVSDICRLKDFQL